MPSMQVEVSDEAWDQLMKLPVTMRARVDAVFDRLRDWPNVSGVKWLKHEWKNHARVRSGDYRVIFRLVNDDLILVVRIADRRDAYAD